MSFAGLFHDKKKSESVVLIDIGTNSVAGAYAHYADGELPVVLYTRRFPVEARESELQKLAILRALKILGDTLIKEGAPILARATGSGRSDAIIVSIDAPWQKTSVRTEHFEQMVPFVFTRGLVVAALEKNSIKVPGKLLVGESVIGTILNGYETRDPYGKKVHRASIVVLTSLIDESVAEDILSIIRGVYHTKRIQLIAGSALRCHSIQKAFPHESDALIFDETGSMTSIALVRKGIFVAIVEVPSSDTADAWVKNVEGELAEIAKRYPLPRTIFLLERESGASVLRQTIDAANIGKLWLSDNPPKIVSVLASHIVGLVRHATVASPDPHLLLMALFHKHGAQEEM